MLRSGSSCNSHIGIVALDHFVVVDSFDEPGGSKDAFVVLLRFGVAVFVVLPEYDVVALDGLPGFAVANFVVLAAFDVADLVLPMLAVACLVEPTHTMTPVPDSVRFEQ